MKRYLPPKVIKTAKYTIILIVILVMYSDVQPSHHIQTVLNLTNSENLKQQLDRLDEKKNHKSDKNINVRKGFWKFGRLTKWKKDKTFKKVLLWNGFPQKESRLWPRVVEPILNGECPESRCTFTTTNSRANQGKADAIVFKSKWLNYMDTFAFPTVRSPHQNWVFMSYETPGLKVSKLRNKDKSIEKKWRKLDGLFNRTMGYRKDADIVISHGFVRKNNNTQNSLLPKLNNKFSNYTKENFRKSSNRKIAPAIWFVSHCNAWSGRDLYVKELQKYIGVHIYGACGTKTCGQDRRIVNPYEVSSDPCFDLVEQEYAFYLSLENSICTDYVTEKAYNALHLATIPVLMTGADIKASFPPHSVIDALQYTPEQLADRMYYLLSHPEAYQQYFHWRKNYSVVSYQSVPNPCGLCAALHSEEWKRENTYDDMTDWFIRKANCTSYMDTWNFGD